jgi:hypothetical protein
VTPSRSTSAVADLNRAMSRDHERDVAERLGGRQTRGSGNQWHGPMDGRQDRYCKSIAFAWDCKATRGESLGVGRRMWAKAVEQANGERPCIPLRFYRNDRLTEKDPDLVVLDFNDFEEMLETIDTLTEQLAAYRRADVLFGQGEEPGVSGCQPRSTP